MGGRALPGQPFVFRGERVSANHGELIDWLTKNKIGWVRTNYWIGYRLAFESGEKVRFIVFHEPSQVRIDSYEEQGQPIIGTAPFVLVPSQSVLVEAGLSNHHIGFKKVRLSNYDVIYDLRPMYHDLELLADLGTKASASIGTLAPSLAIDGQDDTRWGSGQPQRPGQEFRIVFDHPTSIRCVRYELATWRSDYPRLLEIDATLVDGSKKQLLSTDGYLGVRYIDSENEENDVCFDPTNIKELSLIQQGSHPVFDWSIAERQFFR